MQKTIYLITKNQGKIKAANSVFGKYEIELKNVETEFPEIQASSSMEIALYTAKQAAKETGLPVVREDHSLFLEGLGQFPGPFMAYMEKAVSKEKLLVLLTASGNFKGYFEVATAYADASGNEKVVSFKVPMKIKQAEVVADPRGGWNGLICLGEEERALTEYPEEERLHIWNQGYEEIAKYLKTI